ncbi:hypothetical protein ACH5RR_000639 [Cinchona calisaya]|uniref:Uncharacterized protein n=1 Tax=Cinchona calisaya TaxID=153742 RepID=A0ABD3B1X7_9GENT
MGSECSPYKLHYDLSMSKRTRKPSNIKEEDDQSSLHEEHPLEFLNGEKEKGSTSFSEAQENKKSLRQLIGGRSLSQHFSEEEKQFQLIVKQRHDPEEVLKNLKFKRIVSRYAKIFSHFVKLKRKPEMALHKKPVLQLTN